MPGNPEESSVGESHCITSKRPHPSTRASGPLPVLTLGPMLRSDISSSGMAEVSSHCKKTCQCVPTRLMTERFCRTFEKTKRQVCSSGSTAQVSFFLPHRLPSSSRRIAALLFLLASLRSMNREKRDRIGPLAIIAGRSSWCEQTDLGCSSVLRLGAVGLLRLLVSLRAMRGANRRRGLGGPAVRL